MRQYQIYIRGLNPPKALVNVFTSAFAGSSVFGTDCTEKRQKLIERTPP